MALNERIYKRFPFIEDMNKEFDKAIKDMLGDAVEYLKCPEHNIDYSVCPECGEAICKECLE